MMKQSSFADHHHGAVGGGGEEGGGVTTASGQYDQNWSISSFLKSNFSRPRSSTGTCQPVFGGGSLWALINFLMKSHYANYRPKWLAIEFTIWIEIWTADDDDDGKVADKKRR